MKEDSRDNERTVPGRPPEQPSRLLHYDIISRIGGGGMGDMWLATDTRLGRLVALKTIAREHAAKPIFRSRLMSEARAAARLTHPNICSVYAIEEAVDRLFIVMEYVEGQTLRQLREETQPDFELLYKISEQCCSGLQAAHELRVIHRDIKSSNIMVDRHGTVKILDFGLAHIVEEESRTSTSEVVGTFQYMSPEQVGNKTLDQRTDIFSLGVVLYELTTGRLPFEADNLAAIAYAIVNSDPVPMRDLRPSVPAHWEAIVMRALQKDPARRFSTPAEMADHLRDRSSPSPVSLADAGVSIAVFPLRNIGRDPESEYLAEGLCEDLIAKLSRLDDLEVASRTAVMRFTKQPYVPGEVAEQLNASHFLEGSIRRHERRIRINVQVVRSTDGVVVWSDTFDRTVDDFLNLQAEVAEQVAAALNVHISREEAHRIARPASPSPVAYDLYLQGRYHLKRRDHESVHKAISLLQAALEADPNLAVATADLAVAYALCSYYDFDSEKDLTAEAYRLATLAVEQDPASSDAHMALFFVLRGHAIKRGISELRTAVALDPGNAQAHHYLAHAYVQYGLYERAVGHERTAIRLDPFQVISRVHLYRILVYLKREEEATQELTEAARGTVNLDLVHLSRGWKFWITSAWSDAIEELEAALRLQPSSTFAIDYLADCYRRLGLAERARETLEEALGQNRERYALVSRLGQVFFDQRKPDRAAAMFTLAREQLARECASSINPESAVYHYNEARFLALESKPEEALGHLKTAINLDYGHYIDLNIRPDWDPLRPLPEFHEVIEQLKANRQHISSDPDSALG